MEKFNLFRDRKITSWERDKYIIEAENEKEALEKLLQIVGDGQQYEEYTGFIETETLYDTGEDMTVEENLGNSTVEIMNGINTIWNNSEEDPMNILLKEL